MYGNYLSVTGQKLSRSVELASDNSSLSTPLHIDPSLEAHGDSSSTLSSNRWRTPLRYGAVVLVGRLWVRSTFALVQLRKLGQEKLEDIKRYALC